MIRQQLAQNAKQGGAVWRHEIHENVAVIRGARVTEHEQESQTLDLGEGDERRNADHTNQAVKNIQCCGRYSRALFFQHILS